MSKPSLRVLIVGATGSIGKLVVDEAIRQGHEVIAFVRDKRRAAGIAPAVRRIVGDLTQPDTLKEAVSEIDAVVFTHGADGGGKLGAEQVSYGGVRNVLAALNGRSVRIALMTAIGVTNRNGAYNRSTESPDWKRRSERLVRASGLKYTIVRPGWFDYNSENQRQLVFLQGDKRHAGDPSDGVVSRAQIAEVLVHCLTSDAANRKTFELVAERGSATKEFDATLEQLSADVPGVLDAVLDKRDMPSEQEPERVRTDLKTISQLFKSSV